MPADDAEAELLLEEWLQLESEPWNAADSCDEEHESGSAQAAQDGAEDESPTAAADDSASGGGSGPSWADGLPYKLKPGERRWDGEVPPDVVVLAPPRRDANGNLVLPELHGKVADQQPAPAKRQPDIRSEPQRQPPTDSESAGRAQPQRRRQGRRKGGKAQNGGRKGGGTGGPPSAPAWMRSLPPAE